MKYLILYAAFMLSVPVLAQPVDAVMTGGPIYTGQSKVGALAWRNGLIVYAGDRAGLGTLETGPGTKRVDLKGAAAYPGFVDAHAHLSGIGVRELSLNLEGTASLAELQDRLKAYLAANPGTTPIVGRGWIETHWPEARFPTAQDLDAVAPDRPVFLGRADGHAAVVNSAMLQAAGIDAETTDPDGGEILKGADGKPTGMLIDNAMGLTADVRARAARIDPATALAKGAEVYAALGWTGVHNMSVPAAEVPVMEHLAETGHLPIRVYNAIDLGDADWLFDQPIPRTGGQGRVVTRAIKVYADGALGSRGAALLAPYADRSDSDGLLLTNAADILPLYARARDRAVQIATHAIGDKANRLVLDWYEETLGTDGEAHRWRIEHAQIIHLEDIPRFARQGVIASMQPSHAIGDLHFAPDRLGQGRLAGAYAWTSLVDSGAVVAAGSDAPVERGSPLIEFFAAVTRRDQSGYSGPGWHFEQAVDRATALKMFTFWPAYAAFSEEVRGTLAVGKQADISVFSTDLMTVSQAEILQAQAVMTVVGGEIVYQRP